MRKTVARYSPITVFIGLAVVLGYDWFQLSNPLHWAGTVWTSANNSDLMLAMLSLGISMAATAFIGALAWRLIFRDGEAVWVEDKRLYWGVFSRSVEIARIAALRPGTGRSSLFDLVLILDDGSAKKITALFIAGGRWRLKREIEGLKLGLATADYVGGY